MVNWEKYEKEIKELHGDFALRDGKPIDCYAMVDCTDCGFKPSNGESCDYNRTYWFYAEAAELTDAERSLCKLLQDGYIARDKSETLYYHKIKPYKNLNAWGIKDEQWLNISKNFPQCKFEFIKWEDKEPWRISL